MLRECAKFEERKDLVVKGPTLTKTNLPQRH
jgi:hypothetical protein